MFERALSSNNDDKNIIEAGFTLVELLIVILILGILAGIVIFAVGNLTSTSKQSACATEATTFQTAYNAFVAQNKGTKPGTTGGAATYDRVIADLLNAGNGGLAPYNGISAPLSNNGGPFLNKAPVTLTGTPQGYWDNVLTDNTVTLVDTASKTNSSQPAWWFDPATGNVLQTDGAPIGGVNSGNCH